MTALLPLRPDVEAFAQMMEFNLRPRWRPWRTRMGKR